MRDKDLISLEEAYQTVQEGKLKSLAAAAALGLGSLAHGASPTADDLADRANPHSATDSIYSTAPQQPVANTGETNEHKAKTAMQSAISNIEKGKQVDMNTLKLIAAYQDVAERYGLYLVQHGLPIPQVIKMASPNYAKRLEDYVNSNLKN